MQDPSPKYRCGTKPTKHLTKRRILELRDNTSPRSDWDIDLGLNSTRGGLATSTAAHHSSDTTLKCTGLATTAARLSKDPGLLRRRG